MYQFAPYILPAIFLITGVILLCAGARLLKSAVGLSFGLLGAGVGLTVIDYMSVGIPPLLIVLIFGIIAAILAVYLSKLAILISLALLFAVITPVATWHIANLGNFDEKMEESKNAISAVEQEPYTSSAVEIDSSQFSVIEQILIAPLELVANDIKRFLVSRFKIANAALSPLKWQTQLMLVGAALAGLLFGLLVNSFMPYLSTAMVTALGGSFLLITGVRTTMAAIWTPTEMPYIQASVFIWAFIGIAIAGLGLQMTLTRKAKAHKQPVE